MGIEQVGKGKVIPIQWLRALSAPPAPVDPPADRERLMAHLKEELESLPDVRAEKVIEAKLRISTGHYDRPEVRREILRSVLESLLPRRQKPEDPDVGAT